MPSLTAPLASADLVLVAIALPLVFAAAVGAFLSVHPTVAFAAGSVPASGTIGYALFYDPPETG